MYFCFWPTIESGDNKSKSHEHKSNSRPWQRVSVCRGQGAESAGRVPAAAASWTRLRLLRESERLEQRAEALEASSICTTRLGHLLDGGGPVSWGQRASTLTQRHTAESLAPSACTTIEEVGSTGVGALTLGVLALAVSTATFSKVLHVVALHSKYTRH